MWWRRASRWSDPRPDDVAELLNGLGTLLMENDSKLERIAPTLEEK